jgi:hypothetical protein
MSFQFFYKKIVKLKDKPEITKYDSFNLDCVVRTVWYIDEHGKETLVVLLNDGHEMTNVGRPLMNKAGKVVKDAPRVREYVASEIYLDAEDGERYTRLTWAGRDIESAFPKKEKEEKKEKEKELVEVNEVY